MASSSSVEGGRNYQVLVEARQKSIRERHCEVKQPLRWFARNQRPARYYVRQSTASPWSLSLLNLVKCNLLEWRSQIIIVCAVKGSIRLLIIVTFIELWAVFAIQVYPSAMFYDTTTKVKWLSIIVLLSKPGMEVYIKRCVLDGEMVLLITEKDSRRGFCDAFVLMMSQNEGLYPADL